MKICIPTWNDHVSTAFDFADTFRIIEKNDDDVQQEMVNVTALPVMSRIDVLRQNNVDIVICGCISRPAARLIEQTGIHLIPHISGEVNAVLDAFDRNELPQSHLRMPGYGNAFRCGQGNRGGGRGRGNGCRNMRSRGMGRGGGRGRGRGGAMISNSTRTRGRKDNSN